MRSLLTSLLLFSSALLATADYGVFNPSAGKTFNIGDKLEVEWTLGNKVDSTVDVKLVHGPAENLQLFKKLCTCDPKVLKCTTTIDGSFQSGIDYAIIVDGKEAIGFSSFFTIKGNGPLPENKGCPNMGGKDCPENLPCCSSSGFCGSSNDHCGNGCDPKHSFNNKCEVPGKSNPKPDPKPVDPKPVDPPSGSGDKCGDVKCTAEFPCCSEFNFCGSTSDHCGNKCQAGKSFNGVCSAKPIEPQVSSKPPVKPPAKPPVVKCGKKVCNALAPCCSKDNVCGASSKNCGRGCQAKKSFKSKCKKN